MLLETLNPVISFQKKLYLDFLKRIFKITGKNKLALTNYEVEFRKSLPQKYLNASRLNFLDSIDKSNVILFGDFHTLVNSQILLIESIKLYKLENPKAQVVIAMEAFFPKDKKALDFFLNDKICEDEFLIQTEYYKKWVFPGLIIRKYFFLLVIIIFRSYQLILI